MGTSSSVLTVGSESGSVAVRIERIFRPVGRTREAGLRSLVADSKRLLLSMAHGVGGWLRLGHVESRSSCTSKGSSSLMSRGRRLLLLELLKLLLLNKLGLELSKVVWELSRSNSGREVSKGVGGRRSDRLDPSVATKVNRRLAESQRDRGDRLEATLLRLEQKLSLLSLKFVDLLLELKLTKQKSGGSDQRMSIYQYMRNDQ